jgi:hypothetical protein
MNKRLVSISMLLMLLASIISIVPLSVEANSGSGNIRGLWYFDEGTGITAYDSSGNANHGTVYGGAMWTDGKAGKALEFDGVDDYVGVPDSNSLDITGKITVEAWIYPHTVTKMQVIVQKYNYSGPPYNGAYYLGVGGYGYNNKILFGLSHNGYNFYYTLSNTNITANTWTHVAATSNGTHMIVYINGIKDKVATYPPGVIYASTAPLRIGCFLPELGVSRFFDGVIDEVGVSARTIWAVDDDKVQCPIADFTSIQAAINAASPDDTIIVYDGTYNEALYINKNLVIKAESAPVIQGGQLRNTNYGSRKATIFVEDANNVVLQDLDVEGQGLAGGKSYAILYENSSGTVQGCTISPNTVGDMGSVAIAAWDNSDLTIKECAIQNFGRIGVYSNNATTSIENNTIIGQVYSQDSLVNYGIEIEDYSGPSIANITQNVIYNCNNTHPAPLWSSGAIIVDTWREWADYYGLMLLPSRVSITFNEIYDNYEAIEIVANEFSYAHYNNFYNNTWGVWSAPENWTTNPTYYVFDALYNWWGDTTGPYHATSWTYITSPYGPHYGLGDNVSDYVLYYPWLSEPSGSPVEPPTANFTYSPPSPKAGEAVTFDASSSTPNGGAIIEYRWNFGDGNITETPDATILHVYGIPNIYNVTLTVTDSEDLNDTAWQLVTVVSAVKHDISILNVTTSTPHQYPGRPVNITVVVKNNGEVSETFNITIYRNSTEIGKILLTGLEAGNSTTEIFTWDTTGLAPCQNWTISAIAPLVGDINPSDNNMTNGTVKIKMIGDLNADGVIDIFDLVAAATAFGATPSDLSWNSQADIVQDNIIDIFDLVAISMVFGSTCP